MGQTHLIDGVLYGLDRCSQCGVANPLISLVGKSEKLYESKYSSHWHFTGKCSKCRRHILFYGNGAKGGDGTKLEVVQMWPSLPSASEDLPVNARRFLQQALESKHAPDGAIMLAASAIDAMLKEKGYKTGSLYSRIESAANKGVLTPEMRDWAHEIRLSANEPRHADDDFNGATAEDADQVIEFANALGEYLFVLPTRVQKWKEAAQSGG